MTGEIIKIHPPEKSKNGNSYIRVEFKIGEDGFWAHTYLCRDYRNWKYWKGVLKVGNILSRLNLEEKGLVDADSRPLLVEKRHLNKTELQDLFRLGVFG